MSAPPPPPASPRGAAAEGRRTPLPADASPRVRAAARRRADRLRAGLLPVAQTALAAGSAWGLAGLVHERPFFAPVAAVIALGVGRGQRTRRAVELAGGVALGIVVADVVVAALGSSPPVVALVVVLSMLAAIAVGAGDLLVAQAAVSAVIVATLEQPEGGLQPDRAVDAVIGCVVALVIVQVVFREQPERRLERAVAQVAEAVATALRQAAAALRTGEQQLAHRALLQARAAELPLADLEDAVLRARETLGGRGAAAHYAHATDQLGFATRNVRVLARRTVATVRKGTPPPPVADAVERLADALDALAEPGDEPRLRGRALAVEAAALANRALTEPRGLQTTVLVGQVRSTAVDLLRGAGVDEEEAVRAVDEAGGPTG